MYIYIYIKIKWKSNKINTYKLLIVLCLAHSSGLRSDFTLHENVLYNVIQQFKKNNQYIINYLMFFKTYLFLWRHLEMISVL